MCHYYELLLWNCFKKDWPPLHKYGYNCDYKLIKFKLCYGGLSWLRIIYIYNHCFELLYLLIFQEARTPR